MIAANAQIGIARAAMFPAISLTGLAGSESAAFSDLLASGTSIWTLGFALSLPIFDAGRREAAVEQAEARRRQALASYQGSIESAFREVSDALVNLEQTGASEADLLERLQAARSALQLSNERYEAGYSPYLEVLDAQAHRQRGRARLRAQSAGAARLQRRPDESPGRRLECAVTVKGQTKMTAWKLVPRKGLEPPQCCHR